MRLKCIEENIQQDAVEKKTSEKNSFSAACNEENTAHNSLQSFEHIGVKHNVYITRVHAYLYDET